jgi:hypothetical protein
MGKLAINQLIAGLKIQIKLKDPITIKTLLERRDYTLPMSLLSLNVPD